MRAATFRFSTDILQRLGEELITSFDQGIVELVKNAYDADALKCTIQLIRTEKPGGAVIVSDDGDGMSREDILDGWLILGRSRKVPNRRTRRNRLPAGSKGLGRLGALRMGKEVLLVTRPLVEPGVEYSLSIRWADFANSDVVEDVELDIRQSNSESGPGTVIAIRGLSTGTRESEVRRLARELLLLADPFGDPEGFKPELVASGFTDLENLVRRSYFDDCEFRLVARLDHTGHVSAKVFDRSGGVRWVSSKEDLDSAYQAPAATFEIWVFLLLRDSFAGRSATVNEVREWLKQVGGVHLYHRGLRVRPYGDPGHDWLSMNLSRSRDPELRPSTNTSVGRVTVLDENEELLQKTDRTGFIENEAFLELRRFAIESLEWMHSKRLAEREALRTQKKREASERTKQAGVTLEQVIARLPARNRQAVKKAARELESASASERDKLRDELSLYQTLASVGTAVSVFAHEIEGPATDLTASVDAVERRVRKALPGEYESRIERQIEAVKQSAGQVARFATLPLTLLKRSKRRQTILDISSTVRKTVELFEPYLHDARIETICELSDDSTQVRGSVAAIEAIVSNLITNSVKAFKRPDAKLADRKLVVRTTAIEEHVLISVLDNGPGIKKGLVDRIWLPGVTSDENGTGLGLTIVRDTVAELGGRAKAIPSGELGGAEFIIELPRVVS